MSFGRPKSFPVGREHDPPDDRPTNARRDRCGLDRRRSSRRSCRPTRPRGAPDRHRHQVAAWLDHIVEVGGHVMRAGIDEGLGRIGVFLASPLRHAPPWMKTCTGAFGRLRRIEVEPFDRRRPVGKPLRRAEARAHLFAVGRVAIDDLRQVGGVFRLVVGVVQLLLVQVEPDARPLLAHRSSRRLRYRRPACRRDCRSRHPRPRQNRAPIEIAHVALP